MSGPPDVPLGATAVEKQKGVGAAERTLPGLRGRVYRAEVGKKLPKPSNSAALQGRDKGRARRVALQEALPTCASPALHGAERTQAHSLPRLGMDAGGGSAKPNGRPRECNAWQARSKCGHHRLGDGALPKVVEAARGGGAARTWGAFVHAGCTWDAVMR